MIILIIVDNLGLDHWDDHSLSPTKGSDRIDNIIKRHKNHPSSKNIKAKFNSVYSFAFHPVFMEEAKTVIRDIKDNKTVSSEIPIQLLKESEFTFEILTNCIYKSIKTGYFPDSLNEANINLIFLKDDLLDKSNYTHISILPLTSKVYERLIYTYQNNHLSESLIITYQNTQKVTFYVVLERITVHKMHFSYYSNLGKRSYIMEVL